MNIDTPSPLITDSNPVIVKFERVNKFFGKLHVLNDINLEISKNEVVVIMG